MYDLFNKAIDRKTYVRFFLLGMVISPIIFAGSILLSLSIKESVMDERTLLAIPIIGFFLIGVYFYILKIKRLKDLNRTDAELYEAYRTPFGDIVLMFMLLFKPKPTKTNHESHTEPIMGSGSFLLKVLLYLVLLVINYFIILGYSWYRGFEIVTFNDILLHPFQMQTIVYFSAYLFLPYFQSSYLWNYLQRWTKP